MSTILVTPTAQAGGLAVVATAPSITLSGRAQKIARRSGVLAAKTPRTLIGPKTGNATPWRGFADCSFHTATNLPAARDGVELEPVADQFVAKLIGDGLLKLFDLFIVEFDNPARLQVD